MQRTYRKKLRRQRSNISTEAGDETQASVEDVHGEHGACRPKKRLRMVAVEIVSPPRFKKSNRAREADFDVLPSAADAMPGRQPRPSSSSLQASPSTSKGKEKDFPTFGTPLRHTRTLPEQPSTPSPSARNLSNLFDFLPKGSTAAVPETPKTAKTGGLVKRMLGRSRTDPSLDKQSRTTLLDELPTTNPRFGTPIRSPRNVDDTQEIAQLSPSPSKPSLQKHSRTYAGTSRSFLITVPASYPSSNVDEILNPDNQDDLETRESYHDLRTRWGVDDSEDDPRPPSPSPSRPSVRSSDKNISSQVPPLPNGMMNDLKSITELRSKGESRRFHDEVGYLFEGMDSSSSIGLRRASAIEIVIKLCDPEFSRKAKAGDFYGQTWDVLRAAEAGNGDKVLDTILIFFTALAARDSDSLMEIAMKTDCISVLVDLLGSIDHNKDILGLLLGNADKSKLKQAGLLKTDLPSLRLLDDIICKKSGVFTSDTEISSRFVLSHTLAAIPHSLINFRFMPTIFKSLQAELALLLARLPTYASGLPPLSPSHTDIPSLNHIENCLRLFDSFLLRQWAHSDAECWSLDWLSEMSCIEFAGQLEALCMVMEALISDVGYEEKQATAHNCLCVALRIMISLAHEDENWCRTLLSTGFLLPVIVRMVVRSQIFSTKKLEDSDQSATKESMKAFDLLCLALGLLTSLISGTEAAKDLCWQLHMDPACGGNRRCMKECRCAEQRSLLECLVIVHRQITNTEDSEQPGVNYIRGHIAVLLGLLMQNNTKNQSLIMTALPGRSSRDKYNSLIKHIREFVKLFGDLAVRLSALPSETIHDDSETNDDRESGGHVKEGKGDNIARGVIAFLELMLDQTL